MTEGRILFKVMIQPTPANIDEIEAALLAALEKGANVAEDELLEALHATMGKSQIVVERG